MNPTHSLLSALNIPNPTVNTKTKLKLALFTLSRQPSLWHTPAIRVAILAILAERFEVEIEK